MAYWLEEQNYLGKKMLIIRFHRRDIPKRMLTIFRGVWIVFLKRSFTAHFFIYMYFYKCFQTSTTLLLILEFYLVLSKLFAEAVSIKMPDKWFRFTKHNFYIICFWLLSSKISFQEEEERLRLGDIFSFNESVFAEFD